MRAPLLLLLSATFAPAQSHPTWWAYASPTASAIVGIDWQTVRASPLAEPIQAELWGDLNFPDLPFLHNARQIIVSSPDLLALVSGNFSTAAIRDQAANKGLKAMTYRGIDMWFAPQGTLSVARLSDQLVMIGEPKVLEMAVDRNMTDSKNYCPLLTRAAKFSQKDLWVVASQLPDDLANRFVPLDTEAQSFEGWISVRNGLEIEATLAARSEQEAVTSAEKLRKSVPTLPAIARSLEITVEGESLTLALTATKEQVLAALKEPEPIPTPPETIKVETPIQVQQVAVDKPIEAIIEKPLEKVVEKAPLKPQVIRILGLDDGPKEIVLPPAKQP